MKFRYRMWSGSVGSPSNHPNSATAAYGRERESSNSIASDESKKTAIVLHAIFVRPHRRHLLATLSRIIDILFKEPLDRSTSFRTDTYTACSFISLK